MEQDELIRLCGNLTARERYAIMRFRRSPDRCFFMKDLSIGLLSRELTAKVDEDDEQLHDVCVLTPLGQQILDLLSP